MADVERTVLQQGRTWVNWFGDLYFTPRCTAQPRDEADVQAIVRAARLQGLSLRCSGAGHSNPAMVPSSGVHVDFSLMRDVLSLDKEKMRVTIQPGMRVGELSRFLATKGLSLNNQGDIDTQTVIGAIMTGTHGAGITLPCLSAQMVSARIVTAEGEALELSPAHDAEMFRAFRTSLGLFGIVTELTIQAVPGYNILKRHWNTDVERCLTELHGLLQDNRTFWFFWLPNQGSAELFELPPDIPSNATRAADICYMRSYKAMPQGEPAPALHPGESYGHSSAIFPNTYLPNYREMEYTVPFARMEEAFDEIRTLFKTRYPEAMFPVECRPVKADDSYMSAFAERDGYAIGVSGTLEHATWALLLDVDAIFARYDGRPHWGKHHFMSQPRLERLFPRYDAFKRMRRELDPDGVFLNDHLRALFF